MTKRNILAAVLVLVILSGCAVAPDVYEPESIGGSRSLTYSTNKYPGIYYAWAYARKTPPVPNPPTRVPGDPLGSGNYMLGVDCLVYLDNLWPSEGTYDWTELDYCLAQAATKTVKLADGSTVPQPVMFTLPQFMEAGIGDGGRYTVLTIPAWLKAKAGITTTFTSYKGSTYNAIIYKDTDLSKDFLDYMIQFMQAAGARYAGNSQLAAVRVFVGYQGEAQPNRAQDNEDQSAFLANHEAQVIGCYLYREFVQELSAASYNAFPGKAVLPMLGVPPCSFGSDWGFRKDAYGYWKDYSTGELHMGSSINSGAPDLNDADDATASAAYPWRKQRLGTTLNGYNNPVGVEWGLNPTGIGSENPFQYAYWATLNGMGTGADYVISQWTWDAYMRPIMYQWADAWYSTDVATLIARDGEWPTWVGDLAGWSSSGYRGDWANGRLTVLGEDTAFPQVCSPALATAAATRNATTTPTPTWRTCSGSVLPTPSGGLAATPTTDSQFLQHYASRQARAVAANGTIYLRLSSTWTAHYNKTRNVVAEVTYLDAGTGNITLKVPSATSGLITQTIAKGNTGLWKTSTVTLAGASTVNSIASSYGTAFLSIGTGASATNIHALKLRMVDTGGATPTPTATATRTPTRTPTPTPAATATPPASVRINEVCPNPNADMNLDGSISSGDRAIELINWTTSHVDLSGYSLVWNSSPATTYVIPRNARLYSYNYKAIYAGEFSFLMPTSGTLQLKNGGGTVVDSVTYTAQSAGYCYARYPNGTSSWANRLTSLGYVNP